jgi:hypothetical protein
MCSNETSPAGRSPYRSLAGLNDNEHLKPINVKKKVIPEPIDQMHERVRREKMTNFENPPN